MKILVLSNLYPPDFIGGYELVCRQAVDGLLARGHDVRVLTAVPRKPTPPSPHVERSLQLSPLYNGSLLSMLTPAAGRMARYASHWVHAANVYRLLQALEDYCPDVVYLHNLIGLGGLGLLACLNHLRVPWVWQLGDAVPRLLCTAGDVSPSPCGSAGPVVPTLVREYNRLIRGRYLACSSRLVAEIEECGLRLDGQVEVTPNWFVGDPVPRTRFYKGGTLRIVTAGQISHVKGIGLLIETARMLRARGYEDFIVDIYGEVRSQEFQCMIGRAGVEDRVALRGLCSPTDLLALLPTYDVFAFPTWEREPFGCAPLEAAACGCVPVLSDVCGISEWLVHGVHCLKSPRTAGDFATVFQNILDGSVDLEALGRRAAVVVRRDFHLDALLPRVERALEEASKAPREGAGTADEAYRLALLAETLTEVLANRAGAA